MTTPTDELVERPWFQRDPLTGNFVQAAPPKQFSPAEIAAILGRHAEQVAKIKQLQSMLDRAREERDFLLDRAAAAGSCSFSNDRWTGTSSNALVAVAFGRENDCAARPEAPIAEGALVERDLLNDIGVMMSEFVDNWPQPKRAKTALELIAKTLREALDAK